MFGEIRESTGGKGGGIIEGEVVEEMRKNEGQGTQDRNSGSAKMTFMLRSLSENSTEEVPTPTPLLA